ncbi:MAG: hypothetical protein Q9162_000169 [Coniocarpon cinnabarinum]
MASKPIAVIAGIGPGTGASVARRFAKSYPVALLARSAGSYEPLVQEINSSGGKAYGFSADVSDAASVKRAFESIKKEMSNGGEVTAAAAIFNASGGFSRKPFLEVDVQDFRKSLDVSVTGAFNFSQASLPLLVAGTANSEHPPTLVFTGATASVKSNAMMSSFSTGKFALRALSNSLGKEFGPKGVHVAHAVIDGGIDSPRMRQMIQTSDPDALIHPDGIADAYWHLHTQPRSAFSNEIDIRPYCEKW